MATVFTVSVADDPGTAEDGTTGGPGTLSYALAQLNAANPADGPYTINITTNVTLSGELSPILGSVIINGNGHTISATGSNRIFFVGTDTASQNAYPTSIIGQRQQVSLNDVNLDNGVAQGGSATDGGGGGLGAGGALFINQTADVTLTNVGFSGDKAIGGSATIGNALGGGGGGLGGAGGGGSPGGGGGGLFGAGGFGGLSYGLPTLGGGGGGGVFGHGGAELTPSYGFGGGGFSSYLNHNSGPGSLQIYGIEGTGGSSGTYSGGANGGEGAVGAGGGFGGGNATTGYYGKGGNGGFGGGGGQSITVSELPRKGGNGGNGGFGGGGGAASPSGLSVGANGGNGGFGGGGGGSGVVGSGTGFFAGGSGGFGGGGGGGGNLFSGGLGGFGGGGGSAKSGGFGGGAGTFSGLGTGTVVGSGGGGGGLGGAVFVASGGTLTISGNGTLNGTATGGTDGFGTVAPAFGNGIFYQGTDGTTSTLTVGAGDQTFSSSIADYIGSGGTNPSGGTQAANQGGSLAIDKTGTGTLTLAAGNTYSGGTTIGGGSVDLGQTTSAGSGAITFGVTGGQAAGTLVLETTAQVQYGTFGNTLTNFTAGGTLDLQGFARLAAITPVTGNTLTLYGTALVNSGLGPLPNTVAESFTLGGNSALAYTETDDGNGGTLVTAFVCFAGGTRIKTARGDVSVEALQVGDLAVTASGAHRPIRWLGHRTIVCRNQPDERAAWPVRIAAGAFGPDRPARDLYVSPGHSICVDVIGEVLIPAVALVNGSTIAQVPVDAVTYWHVELDSHDILLAENLACESYIEMGNRGFFGEAAVVDLAAGPDAVVRTHADFCRPFFDGGALVEVVRAQLSARAERLGWTLDRSSAFADLHLLVDGTRIDPATRGLSARFAVPADARDVWLVSSSARACDVGVSVDRRHLGVWLAGLTIEDGFACRAIALGDPLLCAGFHALEPDGRRWTAGRARLPAALWNGCEHGSYLRVDLAGPALPRWMEPGVGDMSGLQTAG